MTEIDGRGIVLCVLIYDVRVGRADCRETPCGPLPRTGML